MAIENGKKDQPVPPTDTGVRRRGLLNFGTLMAAFTGASAVAALGASSAQAAPAAPADKYVPIAEKGSPSGVASLDDGAKILPSQLPDLSASYGPDATPMNAKFMPWSSTTVNVKDPQYGAKGDGTTDDSAAFAAAVSTGKAVYVPPGVYVGTWNFDVSQPRFIGSGVDNTTIKINAGEFFVDANRRWHSSHFEGITFDGGAGAIRNRFTGTNTTKRHVVFDCYFYNYTKAAISHESADMPLWSVERNVFRSANDTTSIGISLMGLTDINRIQSNEFQKNHVHIKLGRGGNNAYILNNDFIQYSAAVGGNHRAYIWVAPSLETTNHGQGFVAADNKYGPENMGNDDFRILYADELYGTYSGDRLPNLAADSTGKISGHTFRGGLLYGSGTGSAVPFIYSTTRNIFGALIDGLQVASTPPSMLVKVRAPAKLGPDKANNTIVNVLRQGSNASSLVVTNQPGLFRVVDTSEVFETNPTVATGHPGGLSVAGFINLLTNRVNVGEGFNAGSGVARTAITDSFGGTDAVSIAFTSSNALSGALATVSLKPNMPVWVEIDVAPGDTDPLSEVRVLVSVSGAAAGAEGNHLRALIKPDTGWATHRFQTYFPEGATSSFCHIAKSTGATGTNIKVGRVRIYHALEPVLSDLALPNIRTGTTAPAAGAGDALPATPTGYLTVGINGVARRIAYY